MCRILPNSSHRPQCERRPVIMMQRSSDGRKPSEHPSRHWDNMGIGTSPETMTGPNNNTTQSSAHKKQTYNTQKKTPAHPQKQHTQLTEPTHRKQTKIKKLYQPTIPFLLSTITGTVTQPQTTKQPGQTRRQRQRNKRNDQSKTFYQTLLTPTAHNDTNGEWPHLSSLFLTDKPDNVWWLEMLQLNRLPIDKSTDKWKRIYTHLSNSQADITLLSKVGLNWKMLPSKEQWVERSAGLPQHKYVFNNNIKDTKAKLNGSQFGGTGILISAPMANSSSEASGNPTKLGRWTSIKITGKNNHTLHIVSMYRPVESKEIHSVY